MFIFLFGELDELLNTEHFLAKPYIFIMKQTFQKYEKNFFKLFKNMDLLSKWPETYASFFPSPIM